MSASPSSRNRNRNRNLNLGFLTPPFPCLPYFYPEKYCFFTNILGSHFRKLLNASVTCGEQRRDDAAAFDGYVV